MKKNLTKKIKENYDMMEQRTVITLTQEYLKSVLKYCPLTGVFIWIKRTNQRNKIGDIAGSITSGKYRTIGIKRVYFRTHNLAWLYMYGELYPQGNMVIDHKNGIPDDNRLSNLEVKTQRQNTTNAKCHREGHLPGVTKGYKSNWYSQVYIYNKQYFIGQHDTKEEANEAYMEVLADMEGKDESTYRIPIEILSKYRTYKIKEYN